MKSTIERLQARRASAEGREGGFTLIELLIVIVILGILAAIVVFAVQNLTGQSATASCGSDYKTVETAAEAYLAQEGQYPTSIGQLTGSVPAAPTAGLGPWLKDAPSTAHYTISIDTTNPMPLAGPVMVAAGTHAAADGNANCQYAK
jgi:general secretion pathway protein G